MLIPGPSIPTLFPYTTLFRSWSRAGPRSRRDRRRDHVWQRTGANASAAEREHGPGAHHRALRSEEHTSELQSLTNLVCRLLLEKKKSLEVLVVTHLTLS